MHARIPRDARASLRIDASQFELRVASFVGVRGAHKPRRDVRQSLEREPKLGLSRHDTPFLGRHSDRAVRGLPIVS